MQAFLEDRNPFAFQNQSVWKVLSKENSSADTLLFLVSKKGCKIDPDVQRTLRQCMNDGAIHLPEMNLVIASVKELGFKKDPLYSDICSKSEKLELKLCHPSTMLRLVIQSTEVLFSGSTLFLAMKSITDNGGLPIIYDLTKRSGSLSLGTPDDLMIGYSNGRPSRRFELADKLIFTY